MKDKAKSNIWNLICAVLTVAAGILYTVSVSGEADVRIYPLAGNGELAEAADTAIQVDIPPAEAIAEETGFLTGDVPVPKNVLRGEELFESEETSELININFAGADELMKIPGIGPAKADAILAYRQEYGPFAHIEDIMLVPGIKAGTFEKIKAYIEAGS